MLDSPAFRVEPEWPSPGHVRAFFTTRQGGFSAPPYESLNLALHVGDENGRVKRNRDLVELPAPPLYLNQVHGNRCVSAEDIVSPVDADASYTDKTRTILTVMVADCLPVLFASRQSRIVGAAHAGWRGLANGVLSETVKAMGIEGLIAWMGPAIGPCHYEVGKDVQDQFTDEVGFTENESGRFQMDLYQIARRQLTDLGVEVFGGGFCTYCDEQRFFSYRRDGVTGRMASFIWLD